MSQSVSELSAQQTYCDIMLCEHLNLDERLTWKCHINKISNKISQCMGTITRLKCFQ